MSSYVGARIQIETREGKYEGILHSIDPVTKLISIKQAIALPSGQKYLGILNFYGQEIDDLTVISENELPPPPSSEQNNTQIPEARSYDDPENPEIFDDYQQDNQQVNSYAEGWGLDLGPPYSEEVIIPQEPEENRPMMHSSDSSHQALCEGISDMNLAHSTGSQQPQQSSSPSKPTGTTTGSNQKNYILITQHDALFDQAIADMEQQTAIGLVLKGSKLGRKGKLSLVLVLCDEQIYMFDVLAVPSLFTRKFIDILQTVDITKVIHDCRFVSDLLYHHYGIQLSSVFDTQVGDILIKRRQYMGDFPLKVSGTTESILEYLEISIQELAMHLENTQQIEEDESSWFQRPLPPANIRCALLDTVYLLRLREAITEQLMAEFTCAIDIFLSVERDRLEVDTKKLSSRASYVPRELINNLHHRVSQTGISNARVKPKELSFPLPSSAASTQERGQPPPRGSSGRGLSSLRNQDTPWKVKKSPPGRTLKPSSHRPSRPPLMMGKTETCEGEDNEELLSVSSEESDEAFADSNEKELWQQRYSQNIKPVTLKEALTAKEESDDFVPRSQGVAAASSTHEHERSGHQHPVSRTDKHTVPSRIVRNSSSVPGSEGITETGENGDRLSAEDRLRIPKDSSRAANITDHTYSQQPVSITSSRPTDPRHHDMSQRQSSAGPKRLSNVQQAQVTQRHPNSGQDRVSGQASYADVLSGKKKEEELKIKAKRTLKAIGKALAAGDKFNEDDDDDDDDDDDGGGRDGNTKANSHIGFDGYSSYGQANSGFSGRNKHSPEASSADQGPARTIGRGRASLADHQSQVLNARQSQLQNRSPGGLGLRYAGRARTVQVNFPTAEEIESAPESVPIAAGSAFVSQRAI